MEQEEQVEGLKKELKKETMKSSISILLGLVISPISIFLTIWLTSVLAAPDIKIIDTNIRPVFNDVELKSNHLEYLKNDSYIISIIQTYLDYGSSLDIALAKLKLSTARKLYHQSESIIDKLNTDLSALKSNSRLFNQENIDWRLIKDIPKLHVNKRQIRNGLSSKNSGRYIIRMREELVELARTQTIKISDMKDLFQWIESKALKDKVPDNYVISIAIMNSGDEAGAILPATNIKFKGAEYSLTIKEDGFLQSFKTGKYISIPPNTIKVIKATINKQEHPDKLVITEGEIVTLSIRTSDKTLDYDATYKKI